MRYATLRTNLLSPTWLACPEDERPQSSEPRTQWSIHVQVQERKGALHVITSYSIHYTKLYEVAATRALLGAGTSIEQTNAIRKHLSALKGGQLAAAAGKRHPAG